MYGIKCLGERYEQQCCLEVFCTYSFDVSTIVRTSETIDQFHRKVFWFVARNFSISSLIRILYVIKFPSFLYFWGYHVEACGISYFNFFQYYIKFFCKLSQFVLLAIQISFDRFINDFRRVSSWRVVSTCVFFLLGWQLLVLLLMCSYFCLLHYWKERFKNLLGKAPEII